MKVFKSFYDSELDSWVIINKDTKLEHSPEFVLKEELLQKLEEKSYRADSCSGYLKVISLETLKEFLGEKK